MGRLFRFELRKLFISKYFYILLTVSLVIIGIYGAGQKFLPSSLGLPDEVFEAVFTPYNFAKSALVSSSFSLIAAIFVSINACEDFSHLTIQNVFSKGYTRRKVYISKYLISLLACFIIFILAFGFSYVLGLILFKNFPVNEKHLFLIYLGQVLTVMAYHSLYFFISYLIRKSGGSIAINVIISTMAALVFTLIDYLLKSNDRVASKFWLDNITRNLTAIDTDSDLLTTNLITLSGYIGVFFAGGFLINSRREVK